MFYSLKPLDIEVMKQLHDKVNIVPLIAKADTMTPEECADFKKTVSDHFRQLAVACSAKQFKTINSFFSSCAFGF
jgi:septin family protein